MIAVTTFFTESYEPLAAITVPILQKWCDKHGYFLNINRINNSVFPHFIKTKDARMLLDKGFGGVMAIENDILITNLNHKIEDWLDEKHDFFVTKDVNNFNTGTFIIKNTGWAKAWLEFIDKRNTGNNDEQNICELYCDSAIFESKILCLPHPSINSIPYKYYDTHGYVNYHGQPIPTHEMGNWEYGDFCCHLPAKYNEERIAIFEDMKKYIIYE